MCMDSCRAWPQMLGTPTTSTRGTRESPPPFFFLLLLGIVITKHSLVRSFAHTKAQAFCVSAFVRWHSCRASPAVLNFNDRIRWEASSMGLCSCKHYGKSPCISSF